MYLLSYQKKAWLELLNSNKVTNCLGLLSIVPVLRLKVMYPKTNHG